MSRIRSHSWVAVLLAAVMGLPATSASAHGPQRTWQFQAPYEDYDAQRGGTYCEHHPIEFGTHRCAVTWDASTGEMSLDVGVTYLLPRDSRGEQVSALVRPDYHRGAAVTVTADYRVDRMALRGANGLIQVCMSRVDSLGLTHQTGCDTVMEVAQGSDERIHTTETVSTDLYLNAGDSVAVQTRVFTDIGLTPTTEEAYATFKGALTQVSIVGTHRRAASL